MAERILPPIDAHLLIGVRKERSVARYRVTWSRQADASREPRASVKASDAFEYLPDFSLVFGLESRLQSPGKRDATRPKTGIPELREPAPSRHRAVCQESLDPLIDPPIKPLFPEAWACPSPKGGGVNGPSRPCGVRRSARLNEDSKATSGGLFRIAHLFKFAEQHALRRAQVWRCVQHPGGQRNRWHEFSHVSKSPRLRETAQPILTNVGPVRTSRQRRAFATQSCAPEPRGLSSLIRASTRIDSPQSAPADLR
jgi:hypothetical protein